MLLLNPLTKLQKKSTLKYLSQKRKGKKFVFQRSLFFSKVFGLYLFYHELQFLNGQ
jgi:hypothetical protein